MDEFIETEFIRSEETHIVGGPSMMWPYTYTTEEYLPQDHERIPVGKLAIRRGARVVARDGQVGRVDEFVVDRRSEHITHLVMREGHLWGTKDIAIPVSDIVRMDEDTVYLRLDKASIEALPAIPMRRRQENQP
jgi:sporulation protein YlmC with PRC-barrel domain